MAYDCRFQATMKDHIPREYYRYMSQDRRAKLEIPPPRAMFTKKCMAIPLGRKIPPTPSSILMERAKRNGLRHSVFNARKDVYTGEWKDDYKEGHGTYKSRSGRILYEGEWKKGKAEGYGVLSHQGSQKIYNIYFEGFFKNGKPQGSGSHYYKDGGYYKGDWENGIRNGFGKMWYANRTYYEGEFYDDQRHGQGIFVFKNGNRYIGRWHKDHKHGLGAYYNMDKGQVQMGHWNSDSCINSWIVDMKYRQAVEHPTEFSIPTKAPIVKQSKRYVKEKLEKSHTRDAATQTDE